MKKALKNTSGKAPAWLENTLQGLAFWVGYYNNYRPDMNKSGISEAALVFETCNLLYAHTDNDKKIRCEVLYGDLGSTSAKRQLADIVIYNRNKGKDFDSEPEPECVIEVKRANASVAMILDDIKKLGVLRRETSLSFRTFLLFVSQEERPKKLTTDKGIADKKPNPLGEIKEAKYKVLRVLKASHGFKSQKKAHYACLIEVFSSNK